MEAGSPAPTFVHLHTHSHYSLLDGAGKLDALLKRAKELGMTSLALTDHGAMYGAVEFYELAKKHDIKPIIGVEAYLARRSRHDREPRIDTKPYHQILLAENFEGYQNLLYMISEAHLNGIYYKPRIDKDLLRSHSKGLIATSSCVNGEIPQRLQISWEEGKRALEEFLEIFGEKNFFLELQHHPDFEEQIVLNDQLKRLAAEYKIGLIATNDVHYIYPEDAEAQDVLVCVSSGKTVNDPNRLNMLEHDLSMKSPQEMAEFFADTPEALENTVKIAERCGFEIELGKNILPVYPVPEGFTDRSYLRDLCEKGVKTRFGFDYTIQAPHPEGELLESPMNDPAIPLKDRVIARLEYELSVIEKMGFESYFLIVQDFINWSRDNGIVVGPGRGSAAGSLVGYLSGITDIDPLYHNLIFERFLNPERIGMPDIDTDIEDARRDEVLQYVRERYGADKVAQIITFGTMASRNAIRDVGRALGVSYAECDYIAKLIPSGPGGMTLSEARENIAELKELYESNEQIAKLLDIATRLEGVARHTSIHAAGVIITKEPLTKYVPLQRAAKDENIIVTQYAMTQIEHLGLLKMDFLGLANLSILQQAVRVIRKTRGLDIDFRSLPLDDTASYELLSRAESTGIFQLECLSGDTIVSNTTIKKLYERQDKKVLESVYVDKGEVHKNTILGVFKSGKKQLYNLIATNDWHIKASAEHQFMTSEGWKKLKDIQPGDKVLMKTNAKHLLYSTCLTCGKQISGQKEARSIFCYRCSASFYSNPSKPESREKISQAQFKHYANGGTPWNKGLTTETNPKLKSIGQAISKSLAGLTLEMKYGTERAAKIRSEMSQKMQGEKNHMFGVKAPHRHGGFREDLGHYVRSNWEADFARILNLHNLPYLYEPETFPVVLPDNQKANYTPDFYVPSEDTYYEIKGWMHERDQQKIDAFIAQYPEKNLVVINTTRFAELALQYKSYIAWECPQIPKKNFAYVEIKEIIPAGIEESYDIAMQAPGNNFVANGFLVHNSGGMKRYLKELKPTQFEDIISMVALYRPGPMDAIPDFIESKHGRKEITYLHPILKPILEISYGVIVTQDQVLEVARKFAGFSYGQADVLRKAVGKKIKALLDEQRDKFINGAVATNSDQGVTEALATRVWEFVEPFARYGFNRAHAACYALIAYQTAYLKAHYPVEFMSSLLTSDTNNLDRIGIEIAECREMGIEVLTPDVNESFVEFGAIFYPDADKEKQKYDSYIRFGLGAIKNVGLHPAEAIVKERAESGQFKDLSEFLTRCSLILNKKVLENLTMAGALDSLGERGQILYNLEAILKFLSSFNKQKNSIQHSLFDGVEDATIEHTLELAPAEPTPSRQRLTWERDLLGVYLSDHPITSYLPFLPPDRETIITLPKFDDGTTVKICGVVMAVRKILTKTNKNMAFIQIEDETGLTEVIAFPKVWDEKEKALEAGKAVIIEGKISRKDRRRDIGDAESGEVEEIKVLIDTCTVVSDTGSTARIRATRLVLTIPEHGDRDLLQSVKSALEKFPGKIPVTLMLPTLEGTKPMVISHKVDPVEGLYVQLGSLLGAEMIGVE